MEQGTQESRNLAGRDYVLEQLRRIDLTATIGMLFRHNMLPAEDYHFERHGGALGCVSKTEYIERFRLALQRPCTELYVLRQSALRPNLMWYAIDKPSGEVIQFSQATMRVHSFYRSASWERFITSTQAVRVWFDGAIWRIEDE